MRRLVARLCGFALLLSWLAALAPAEPIPVRYRQGSSHGFLALKTLEGALIATGESTQTVRGDRVRNTIKTSR
jgi:hypothetical protein